MFLKNVVIFFLLGNFYGCFSKQILTIDEWWGRTGDRLVQVTRALWAGHQNKIDFYWNHFPHAEKFKFSELLPKYSPDMFPELPRVKIKAEKTLRNKSLQAVFLYDYTCDLVAESKNNHIVLRDLVRDDSFMKSLKKLLSPTCEIPVRIIPQDHISIAVHVRTGMGYDDNVPSASLQLYDQPNFKKEKPWNMPKNNHKDAAYPLKFIPLQYYIDQLIKISEYMPHVNLYVYIFTDHFYPDQLCKTFEKKVHNPRMIFDSYKKVGKELPYVIDDFFDMAYNFDIFIRGGSNLGLMADLIGNHKLIFRPVEVAWYGQRLVVTKVDMVGRDKDFLHIWGLTDSCTDGFDSVRLS
jgi:hypothetical protein